MATSYAPGQEKVQVTAAPNLQTERARIDPASSADQLLAALGAGSVQQELNTFNQKYEQDKLQAQTVKFDWYVEQFQKDQASGAVSQAQVKSRFPETVPIIASRIAEAIGQKRGREDYQSTLDEINGNDALRLDTTARNAFLAKRKAEILGSIPEGNDFYGAGVAGSLDKLTRQYEANWQTETAAYQQKLQLEQFSGKVVDALNSESPQTGLMALDAEFAGSSSLNPLERNKAVVSAAIDLAWANDGDPKVLDMVPARFLNIDSKAALAKTRTQITEKRMSDFRNAAALKAERQREELRVSKIGILQDFTEGKPVDPAAYRGDPEAFAFAMNMREAPRIAESTSAGNAAKIREYLLTGATNGDVGTVQELTDKLLSNRDLNAKDIQGLIGELPKLVEGRNLMSDPTVRQPLQDFLRPALDVLGKSTNATIQSLVSGRNLEMQVTRGYDRDIEGGFRAHFEETGKWPTGNAKRLIIREATDRAEVRLEKLTKIGAEQAPAATPTKSPPVANNPATSRPTPSASKATPAGDAIAAELARREGK